MRTHSITRRIFRHITSQTIRHFFFFGSSNLSSAVALIVRTSNRRDEMRKKSWATSEGIEIHKEATVHAESIMPYVFSPLFSPFFFVLGERGKKDLQGNLPQNCRYPFSLLLESVYRLDLCFFHVEHRAQQTWEDKLGVFFLLIMLWSRHVKPSSAKGEKRQKRKSIPKFVQAEDLPESETMYKPTN